MHFAGSQEYSERPIFSDFGVSVDGMFDLFFCVLILMPRDLMVTTREETAKRMLK